MITQAIFKVMMLVLKISFFLMPTITELPFGLDGIFALAIGYFKGFMETLPYVETVWHAFLWLVLFEVSLLLLKLFLGSRTPVNNVFH